MKYTKKEKEFIESIISAGDEFSDALDELQRVLFNVDCYEDGVVEIEVIDEIKKRHQLNQMAIIGILHSSPVKNWLSEAIKD